MNQIVSRTALNISPGDKIFYPIENNNWDYESDVKAYVAIQHSENELYLEYKVNESNVRAIHLEYNDPVYEDSCVEFFISFDHSNYYNLEFNCIGNILCGYGKGRENRTLLGPDMLRKIKVIPSLGFNKIEIINRPIEWTLNAVIPKELFSHDRIESFKGLKAMGNFYKCGDKQEKPHYLSWNAIHSEMPDFHLPEYFGSIEFKNE